MQHVRSSVVLGFPHAVRSAWVTGFHPSSPILCQSRVATAVVTPCCLGPPVMKIQNSRYSVTPRPSALRSVRLSPDLFATTASADFSPVLRDEISPGKALELSPHAARLYPSRLDGLWASLFRASSPAQPASLSVRVPAVAGLPPASFSLRLTASALRFGYGCHCQLRQRLSRC